jgi:hypothetical protein
VRREIKLTMLKKQKQLQQKE